MSAIKSRAKARSVPQASGPNMGALLTLAELLDEVKRLGLDPTLTTISVGNNPVVARSEAWLISGYEVRFLGTCNHEEWD